MSRHEAEYSNTPYKGLLRIFSVDAYLLVQPVLFDNNIHMENKSRIEKT